MSKLQIAIPSKGRLKDTCLELFVRAGLSVTPPKDSRSYQTVVAGRDDVEVSFLSASEISRELIAGRVHMGITGEDLARESTAHADDYLTFDVKLGFGQADVIVAVPEAWVDVATMADLDDVASDFKTRYGRRLRVATKYWQLTQSFFSQHGVGVYRIVESLGATEGAPAAGSADAIVDITSTGSTIKANQLKILNDGVILRSEANLISSNLAYWSSGTTSSANDIRQALAAATI